MQVDVEEDSAEQPVTMEMQGRGEGTQVKKERKGASTRKLFNKNDGSKNAR